MKYKLVLTGIISSAFLYGCNIGGANISDPVGEYDENEVKPAKLVAGFPWFSKYKNPTAYIPLECYTDTGKAKTGEAFANPCYVCHNAGNTPVDNAGDWENQINWLRFPANDNPWLNAVAPEKTIEKPLSNGKKWTELDEINNQVKDNKENKIIKIDDWIKQNNWEDAYNNEVYIGSDNPFGLGKYKLDIPPLYKWDSNNNRFVKTNYIDNEGFIYSSENEHTNNTNTWWRAYDWKHFPGFFPTNGRLDSAMIRLPEVFRKENGQYNKEIYKINLAILECAVKQLTENCEVEPLDTNLLDRYGINYTTTNSTIIFNQVPNKYIGDASNIDVWQIKSDGTKVGLYPVGTELAHPIYYIDPDWESRPDLAAKTGHLKEFRYMKKLAMPDINVGGEEEEENIDYFPYDNGLMPNDPETWLMGGWIEDKDGKLRPQSEEEMAFCMACHGAISGTVDSTFTYWRKLTGSTGWKDTDYGYNKDVKDIKYWAEKLNQIEDENASVYLGKIAGKYDPKDYGEYQLYFTMTNGIDHFRSNKEGICRILGYDTYDQSNDNCKKTTSQKIEELKELLINVRTTFIIQNANNVNNDQSKKSITDGSYSIDLEIGKEFSKNDKVYLYFEHGNGTGVTDELQLFGNVNADATGEESLYLVEGWYEYNFQNFPLKLTVGQLDPTCYIDDNEYANDETIQFLSDIFVNSPAIDFPSSSIGANFQLSLLNFLDIDFLSMSAKSNLEDIFDDMFIANQFKFKTKIFNKSGNYRFYIWVNTSKHTKWNNPLKTNEKNYGFGVSFDQEITDIIGIFFRYSWQNPKVYIEDNGFNIEHFWSIGFQINGNLWKRENDTFGIGFGQLIPSNDFKNSVNQKLESENHLEAYYNFQLNKHLNLSPDLQIIWNPYGDSNSDTIYVLGMRGQLNF